MQNRFKFRVWKGQENRMVYDVTYLNPLILDPAIKEENKHNILMQCTGLKDKNGKLIYEGDICKYKFEEIGEQKAIIYFNKELCSFLAKPLNDFQYTKINNCEVIGNIYLDSHLLEN